MSTTQGRIQIRIWFGIKMECRIWIRIGIKTISVYSTGRIYEP